MQQEIKLAQFEGPFDLLLGLIKERELNITEVALSQVTEQYLEYLEGLEEGRAEALADFLLVAAKLILLKSNQLLPQFVPEDDDDLNLADQLRLYQAFLEASKALNNRWQEEGVSFFHFEPPKRPDEFIPPANLTLANLKISFVELVERIAPPKKLPHTTIEGIISVKEKIVEIKKILVSKKTVRFGDMYVECQNRAEVVVGFLALLELVKQKTVYLKQSQSFGDIMISKL